MIIDGKNGESILALRRSLDYANGGWSNHYIVCKKCNEPLFIKGNRQECPECGLTLPVENPLIGQWKSATSDLKDYDDSSQCNEIKFIANYTPCHDNYYGEYYAPKYKECFEGLVKVVSKGYFDVQRKLGVSKEKELEEFQKTRDRIKWIENLPWNR